MRVSQQIGWSQESNLLWEILKQLNKLAGLFKPKYKVYTALLTQSGGSGTSSLNDEPLTIGVTYLITDLGGSGWDFTNVGAPNNNNGTYFVATGTTPNSWGDLGVSLDFIIGAPVVTVLENTIGNIWWTFVADGEYYANSDNIFPSNKTFCQNIIISSSPNYLLSFIVNDNYVDFICTDGNNNLNNTPIEIRVYN